MSSLVVVPMMLTSATAHTIGAVRMPHVAARTPHAARMLCDFGDVWDDLEMQSTLTSDVLYVDRLRKAGRSALLSTPALSALAARDQHKLNRATGWASIGLAVAEKEMEYTITAKFPGVQARDLQVSLDVDGRVLTITGESETVEGNIKVITTVDRSTLLPGDAIAAERLVTMEDGKATITLPKAAALLSPEAEHEDVLESRAYDNPVAASSESEPRAATRPRAAGWIGRLFKGRRTRDVVAKDVLSSSASDSMQPATSTTAAGDMRVFFDPVYGACFLEL